MTTGAGNDLERATELARKMVCDWGMSEELGPLTFGKKEEQIFLGREIAQHRDYSEETARKIDAEVKKLILDAYRKGQEPIKGNLEILHRLAQILLEKETLDGDTIDPDYSRRFPGVLGDRTVRDSGSRKRPYGFGRPIRGSDVF